jgi:hypothetical protein
MHRWLRVCASFEEEAAADREFWAALSPDQRVAVVEEMRQNGWKVTGGRGEGFQRFLEVLERPRG